ncbi:putative U-box domain-containing protein 13 [Cocos nucifera]|uniref:Putative U-box domain-containing protein 13 n=1 Tax=Cocos nucifera TaxID=13894 RepID=A0A8K0INV9_COCNU|nr:putative U-box domain-containing protein 13 [Cocos nucifera]
MNRSERLVKLLQAKVSVVGSDEVETRWRIVVFEELQRMVGRLQFGGGDNVGGDRRKEVTREVKRLAKDDAEARRMLTMLGAIPPLARHDALRELFNLSIAAANTPYLIDTDIIPCLLAVVSDMEVSEWVLSVISNLVTMPEGQRAMS